MSMSASPPRKPWVLTRETFDQLLVRLHPDRDRAGEEYELLRLKLVEFFKARACLAPEDRADEVFNRLVRRIAEGEVIENLPGYCYGVARRVWLESLKGPDARRAPFEEPPAAWPAPEEALEERARLECLEQCLRRLAPDEVRLLFDYCADGERPRKEARREQAERMRISMTNLRLRVHRTKLRLEACVADCREQGPKKLKYI